jgi:hypothetical protein
VNWSSGERDFCVKALPERGRRCVVGAQLHASEAAYLGNSDFGHASWAEKGIKMAGILRRAIIPVAAFMLSVASVLLVLLVDIAWF